MARQIIKAPDDTYFIWSTIVEDVILYDAPAEDIITEYKEEYGRRGEEKAKEVIAALDCGEKPYHQFTMTFEQAMDQRTWNKSEAESKSDVEYNSWIEKQWEIIQSR